MTAAGVDDLVLRIDGSEPVTPATVEAVLGICDRAEDGYAAGLLTVHVSGVPAPGWTSDLSVGLTTKWERAVRRLERLGLLTAGVATGDCGGAALDLLLATDVRIAVAGARLVVPVSGDATWPGMALYRLARQGATAGLRRAALLGTPLDAARAVAAGVIDVVVDRPEPALAEIAAAAAGITGTELAIRRQLMLDAAEHSFEEAVGSHLAACDRTLRRAAAS
ncbi:enoyl-CoA-hydratase DpgB [Actinoplanes teichomyceticus]|uniref:(3,5-dihydroxycyclohex-3-enyl)acetyl-CoA dehydratase subunit B n=1 Tax=Actinoplanes teichomyceticus TaxID=1867 RepID=Q6ZZH5_ACTTI|nr:enoyl-CoA-hydratase DpgB [Actinoplanes teichomyceticus]TWG09460.1 (3,5-dihydroxycyclohex-3-enyl)acetyl-CoA dehydratase subunit B [Actinoplanes teichomyceticus]CAE53372.1 DpgB protein [Actinoplanes teichomyceticus]CAG15030.1 DpgB protein [Actinoplanes teichomyceticus]